ncbi:hypothetical protein acsn021_21860 [Anaerocolumna cellulosilytica]|uniref:Uncharacterized protein n=1 Tax=Anaerocolumna cellulosilytica TaxID=433286 RepID=A0A6S6R3J0_9FIRM|nr:DUF6512 family protein [Anaerocolumna cellulosilytica]MBB5194171.1 hypothetical protein [Anaerocolumna cellulosilytica]BCJ94617.1 hypothetical protein acsn021_21860 [Anaerocolumna cellulosilytica]
MYKKLVYYELAGFILVLIFGTLLHFVFEWSGRNFLVAFFSPVNESVWEHLKLLFMPFLVFSFIEYFILCKKFKSFIPAKATGIVIGLCSIISLSYTFTGIIGTHVLAIDIGIFVVSTLITYTISYCMIKNWNVDGILLNSLGLLVITLLFLIFMIFTFYPPVNNLFQDPNTLSYGLDEK